MKLYIRDKLFSDAGKDVDLTEPTAVVYKFLHSMFFLCNVTVKGVAITQTNEH